MKHSFWIVGTVCASALPAQVICDWSDGVVSPLGHVGPRDVSAGDIDGDGDIDIAVISREDDRVAWHENIGGDGLLWSMHTISVSLDSGRAVEVTDMDGDTDLDVLSFSVSGVFWHENASGNGSSWVSHTISATPTQSGALVDVDLDLDLDVVAGGFAPEGEVIWYENVNGNGSLWVGTQVDSMLGQVLSVSGEDIDGDGDQDLVSASESLCEFNWHENTLGDGSAWTTHLLPELLQAASSTWCGDMDGDQDIDVLAAAFSDNRIGFFENVSGDGTAWNHKVIYSAMGFAGTFFVEGVDIDGDGDTDVLSTAAVNNNMQWHENVDGLGSTWATHMVSQALNFPIGAQAVDVDNDGDLDCISASSGDNRVLWHENVDILATEVIRAGTPPNPTVFLQGVSSPPVLGETWDPVVDHASFFPSAVIDVMSFSSNGPINIALPSGQLLCAPPFLKPLAVVIAGAPFSVSIPSDCGLFGAMLCVQGASYGGGQLLLTNAIDITLGNR